MKTKKCPVCKTDMYEIERRGVIIDRCPECLGIWLDKGELDKIVERRKKFYKKVYKKWSPARVGIRPSGPSFGDINTLVGIEEA